RASRRAARGAFGTGRSQRGRGGRARDAHGGARGALGRDDDRPPLRTRGRAMVTEAEVWDALETIPDPEIPVISLVDLGVIRSVDRALENIFGPTPCRSLRYCRSCRQPFEQFKTI